MKSTNLIPKSTSGFKKVYSDEDKTDDIDAFVIADRLRFGRLPAPYTKQRDYLPLQHLTRYCFHLVETIALRKKVLSYSSILGKVFNLPLSYQTILNYTEKVAPYCHRFNIAYKGEVDHNQAGDEVYIKVRGKNNFVFFFISSKSCKITSYHTDGTRDTLSAVIAMNKAIRTVSPEKEIVLVTDGHYSYPAGIHFIN